MSLVIALSSLSQLAIWWCNAGGLHRRPHPLLDFGAIGREIGGLRLVLLTEERQMRLQVVIARGLPFAPVGESCNGLLAGIQEIRDKALVLNPFIAAADLDRIVVRLREFRILEGEIGIAKKRLSRAGSARVRAKFVDLEQDRNKAEQRHGRLRHLRQRPVSLPP